MFYIIIIQMITWLQVLILGLIPLGQLWARIFYFKGSLDKWWLMFPMLLIPPFSFIPMLLMKFGFVQDGKGSDPIDKIMLLPIIAKFIIPFILPYMIDEEDHGMLFTLVGITLQILTIMIANLTRRWYNCTKDNKPGAESIGISFDSIGKAGMDSVIAYGIGEIIPFGFGFIPVIGIVYSIIEALPVIGPFVHDIFWTLGFTATYILINMFNGDDLNKYCNTPFTGNTQDRIPFIISTIAIIVLKFIF
jgi:hypothetical protein